MMVSAITTNFRKVLKRFTKNDISNLVEDWELLSSYKDEITEILSFGRNVKKRFSQFILLQFGNNLLTERHIEEAELLYVSYHSNAKIWRLHQLEYDGQLQRQTAAAFRDRLKEKLSGDGPRARVFVRKIGDALWTRIVPLKKKRGRRRRLPAELDRPYYLVYYYTTDYFATYGLKESHVSQLHQSLMEVLNVKTIEELPLRGRDIEALVQLALNKEHYKGKDLQVIYKKAAVKRRVKRCYDDLDIQILDGNINEKRRKKDMINVKFGAYVLPPLEKLEFKFETGFGGSLYAPDMNPDPFKTRALFEGRNTLEGIVELVEAGIIDMPVPKHLSSLPHLAKNSLLIRDRRRDRNNSTIQSTQT